MAIGLTLTGVYKNALTRGGTGNLPSNASVMIGDDGVAYGCAQLDNAGAGEFLTIFRLSDGVEIARISDTEVNAAVTAVHGYSFTFTDRPNAGGVNDGVHAFTFTQDTGAGGGLDAAYALIFWKVDSGGNVVRNGVYVGEGSSVSGPNMIGQESICTAGILGDYFCFIAYDGTTQTGCFPPPGTDTDEWAARANEVSDRILDENDATNMEDPLNTWGSYFSRDSGPFILGDQIYMLINEAIVTDHNDNGGAPAPIDLIAATYTNGALVKFGWSNGSVNGNPTLQIDSYSVVNSEMSGFPWSDMSVASDDTTTDYQDDYWADPAISYDENGDPVVIFIKRFDGSDDRSPTGHRIRARVYTYATNTFTAVADADQEGSLYDTVADLGVASGGRYTLNYANAKALFDYTTGKVYLVEQCASGSPSPVTNDYVISELGTLQLTAPVSLPAPDDPSTDEAYTEFSAADLTGTWERRLPVINTGLGLVGGGVISEIDDGSIEANFALLFWDDIIEWAFSHPWTWAKTQKRLNSLEPDPTARFEHAWQIPIDMIRVLTVTRNGDPIEYDIYKDKVFTVWNENNTLVMDYIAYRDIQEWPPAFKVAIAFKIAEMFMRYTKTQEGIEEIYKDLSEIWMRRAKSIDAQTTRSKKIRTNRFLATRYY